MSESTSKAHLAQDMEDLPRGLVDSEAETSVVAGLLACPDTFLDVCDVLSVDDFAGAAHAEVFAAMLACDAAGRPLDVVTVSEELRRSGSLERVGGVAALRSLLSRAVLAESVPAHAAIVAERAQLRRLVAAGRDISLLPQRPGISAADALSEAERRVFELGSSRSSSSMVAMSEAVPAMLEDLARARSSVLLGHATGFPGLDAMTGGLQGGQLVIVAARPSMGKSAFAVQVARHIAETSGMVVPLLSFEMSTSEIAMRLLASEMRFDLLRLRRGDVPPGRERDLAEAAQRLQDVQLLIDDDPPETIASMRSAMRRLARRAQVGAVVVDYLQLMSGDRSSFVENRNQEVSEISRGLKRMATELDVPVIALSQLNRALEQRPNKRPNLSDLRESGSLEQDASAVMFLFRPWLYDQSADREAAELIVAKQRNGPVGTVDLRFSPESARFFSAPSSQPPSSGAEVPF